MNGYNLSLIIPTARYSPVLVKVLKCIRKAMTSENIEIIIASTTDNPGNKIYERVCRAIKNCRLLILERRSFTDSRSPHKNIAVNVSKGRYIYIVDDDAMITMKLLRTIIEIIENEGCDAILHPMIPLPLSTWARVRMIEKLHSSFNLYQSSCRIIKRELFIKLGGYREDLVLGEDIEFQHRLLKIKPKICVIQLSKGFELHLGEYKTLKEYVIRAWYYGRYAGVLVQQVNPLIAYKAYIKPSRALINSLRLLFFAWMLYKCTTLVSTMLRASSRLFGFLVPFLRLKRDS